MNSLLLIFLAFPLLVLGRMHRSHDQSESRETVIEFFSGPHQPLPNRYGRFVHFDYPRRPYNSRGAYETPVSYGQYNNGPSYGAEYPIPAAPAQPYPVDNSPSYSAPAAQPYNGPN